MSVPPNGTLCNKTRDFASFLLILVLFFVSRFLYASNIHHGECVSHQEAHGVWPWCECHFIFVLITQNRRHSRCRTCDSTCSIWKAHLRFRSMESYYPTSYLKEIYSAPENVPTMQYQKRKCNTALTCFVNKIAPVSCDLSGFFNKLSFSFQLFLFLTWFKLYVHRHLFWQKFIPRMTWKKLNTADTKF